MNATSAVFRAFGRARCGRRIKAALGSFVGARLSPRLGSLRRLACGLLERQLWGTGLLHDGRSIARGYLGSRYAILLIRPCLSVGLRIGPELGASHIRKIMNWKSIRLELARTGEFPAGSVSRAYLIRLPLDDEDRVDARAFDRSPQRATVRRHWSSEPDERGHILRDGREWHLQCNGEMRSLLFDSQPVRLGGEVSVIERDGSTLPFRIASIR